MISGVYTITTPSGKVYVGSAVNFSRRWHVHKSRLRRKTHDNAKLQAALDKYGEKLEFKKIIICARDHVVLYEQLAIDAINPELNICRIAGSTLGYRHTEETKEKFGSRPISYGNKGKKHSEETKSRISAAKTGIPNIYAKGRAVPDDVRKKISTSLKGRFVGDKHPCFGVKRSEESKRKMSESHIGQINNAASIPVRCVDLGIEFLSSSDAARWIISKGVTTATSSYIAAAARGAFKTAYGYSWERI